MVFWMKTDRAAGMATVLVRLSTYNVVAADRASTLFTVLVALCNPGRAVNILNVKRHTGSAAWWKKRECEPRLPGRHANMVSRLIAPWSMCAVNVFRQLFLEWEIAVQLCEMQSGEVYGDCSSDSPSS